MDVLVNEKCFSLDEETGKSILEKFKNFFPHDQIVMTHLETSPEVEALSLALRNELLEDHWTDLSMEAAIEALAQAQTDILRVQEKQTSRRRRVEAIIKLLAPKP